MSQVTRQHLIGGFSKSEGQTLKELEEEAAAVRLRHERGELDSSQAAEILRDLKRRNMGVFERLFHYL